MNWSVVRLKVILFQFDLKRICFIQIRSMLTYLEGARFKLQSALLELDHKPRTTHPLASHIQITRDRTGLQQSVLKVPLWLKSGSQCLSRNIDDNSASVSDNGMSVDDENDLSIKKLDKNFIRSQSNVEYASTQYQSITRMLPIENVAFDRGIADGGSNRQDSDYGNLYYYNASIEFIRTLINHFR